MLFRDVEVAGRGHRDVRVTGDAVTEIGEDLVGQDVIDGRGGALLPGLHDHHCHLLAMAAAGVSQLFGPPAVRDRRSLAAALQVDAVGWIRGVGYHESVAGDLDRASLDAMRADVPVRVQHRSGALWMLNGAAVDELGLQHSQFDGIERDVSGRPTGRLWRADTWLRSRLVSTPPDLSTVSRQLAAYGVTGVTDATPDVSGDVVALLRGGALLQRVVLLGDPDARTPVKLVVPDHELPTYPLLVAALSAARPRLVAVHCVTRAALVLVLTALAEVGTVRGDRIEHAAVAPPAAIALMCELGLTVVTQPSLPWLRGDDYLADVEADDLNSLWPFASFVDAGVPVGCSSDAPYGDADPWASVRAAVARRTVSGRPIGAGEAVSSAQALAGYLSAPDDPGGPARTVAVGGPADLVLLDRPLAHVLDHPYAEHVATTLVGAASPSIASLSTMTAIGSVDDLVSAAITRRSRFDADALRHPTGHRRPGRIGRAGRARRARRRRPPTSSGSAQRRPPPARSLGTAPSRSGPPDVRLRRGGGRCSTPWPAPW